MTQASGDNENEKLKQEIARLQKELATALAQTEECHRARIELSARIDILNAKLEEITNAKFKCEQALESAKATIQSQKEEIGKLQTSVKTTETLLQATRAERDKCAKELSQLKADLESRIAAEVKSALDRVQKEHEQVAAQWAKEKADYIAEIEALKAHLEDSGVKTYVYPTDLASKFAQVIESQAINPQTIPGRQYSAALTSMEVEARGVLEAPRTDEEQPRFVTVNTAKVDPGTLSTLRMTFKILPKLESPGE